jgi:hypothetical protein
MKLQAPYSRRAQSGQDWLFDWLALLTPVRFVTEYHLYKNSSTQKHKKLTKTACG